MSNKELVDVNSVTRRRSAAGKVSAGLGRWLTVTCGLTACTPGSALGPTDSNEYVKGSLYPFILQFDCYKK